ncbi:MAG TPA: PQQ-binding-like beta-propeller repeat protein [Blastocatellia bacterium]|nr:PQQ-binding-like beta-propeller repeat protein [Blastocatellia bacterium]
MNHSALRFPAILLLLGTLLSASPGNAPAPEIHWPTFRGPNASGVAEGFVTPTKWNAPAGENVKWKTPIPGLGHSSPVIWGNQVFITSAISGQKDAKLRVGLYGDIASVEDDTPHKWMVYCLDKQTGKILWEQVAYTGVPKIKRHTKATHANSTPATDGQRLVVMFGSEGLYCYDLNGKLLWKKDLGVLDSGFYMVPSAQWEFGSSPIIFEDKVFLQCDIQKDSFVAAFSIKDGSEIWRTPRQDVPTWSSPTVYRSGDRTLLLINGYKHTGGYDASTGKEIWRLQGGGDIPVPTPIVAHDLVFITNAHGRLAPIYAIRLDATGDISLKEDATSNKYVAWSVPRDGAYMITPLVYGDYLYSSKNNGVLNCFEAKTGARVYQERLGEGTTGFTASPVAAAGKLYFSSEDGDIYVVKAGPKFEALAKNSMGEICMATPAISEGTLFFRTQGHLIAIADKSSSK